MRQCIEGALSSDEASNLASEVGYLEFSDVRLGGILGLIGAAFPVSLEAPAYCRVEHKHSGHPWHTDKGANGHMGWCEYSATILLTPPSEFTGGGIYFRDTGPDVPIFHYLDLWVWDAAAENAHCVAAHKGNRRALIMFLGGIDV